MKRNEISPKVTDSLFQRKHQWALRNTTLPESNLAVIYITTSNIYVFFNLKLFTPFNL